MTQSHVTWRPMHQAPLDGSWIVARGASGYAGTKYRLMVCRYEASRADEDDVDYRLGFDKDAWRNHCGDNLQDDGAFPTEWCFLSDLGLE